MAKQTKLTKKDRDQQITWLTNSLIQTSRVLEEYIKFKGDNVDFKKRLVEISEEEKAKNDSSNASKVDNKEG